MAWQTVRSRGGAALVGVLGVVMMSAVPATAAPPNTDVPSCNGVLHGGGEGEGQLVKTFVSETVNNDGTVTLVYSLTTQRPTPGTYRVRDCAFVDTNMNGEFDAGEPLFGTDEKAVQFTSSSHQISITVQAKSGDRVCDRAALSSESGGFTDKSGSHDSPFLCHVVGTPPPAISEVGAAVLLPLSALALLGGGFLVLRRRGVRQRPA
jgi:hypothetical protein